MHITILLPPPPCLMSLSLMSHVKFTKCPCHPVNLRVKGHRGRLQTLLTCYWGESPPSLLRYTPNADRVGALNGFPQSRMSILRNGNVACHCCLFSPMSHVKFKKMLCRMSQYFLHSLSHVTKPYVDTFKKKLYRPVSFRSQGL